MVNRGATNGQTQKWNLQVPKYDLEIPTEMRQARPGSNPGLPHAKRVGYHYAKGHLYNICVYMYEFSKLTMYLKKLTFKVNMLTFKVETKS